MKQLLQNLALALLGAGLLPLAALAQGPTPDPSFVPPALFPPGQARSPILLDMVRQPDGKFVVVGGFDTRGALPARNVCRLLPDGRLDPGFVAAGTNEAVECVALQPDGKLLIGGGFSAVNGQPRNGVARLLPNGALDAAFGSPFVTLIGGPFPIASRVRRLAVQPGLGVVALGDMYLPAGAGTTAPASVVRLTEATGALDPTFQNVFPATIAYYTASVLALANGRLVLTGAARRVGGRRCTVWGTLPNGTLDPTFVPFPDTTAAYNLARDPATGSLYVSSGAGASKLLRLLPNGTRDPAFDATGAFVNNTFETSAMAVQPNGRLLLGGLLTVAPSRFVGTWRLLPDGTRDPSYQPANGPDGAVYQVLVQPDGALLFCGSFGQQLANGSLLCLARMLDPNVLLGARAADDGADGLAAWPVPAREALHLRLPAGRPPRQAALLDALGRVVLRQPLAARQVAPVLPVAGLPPGTYLLRVDFADGPPAYRRVVVE